MQLHEFFSNMLQPMKSDNKNDSLLKELGIIKRQNLNTG